MKGTIPMFMGIIIIAVVAAIVLIPGLGVTAYSYIYSAITGEAVSCNIAPYNSACLCNEDEDKLSLEAYSLNKYVCENKEKVVYPGTEGWRIEAINLAQSYIRSEYPECDMATCSNGEWQVDVSWRNFESRVVYVECVNLDNVFSSASFDVVTGTPTTVGCKNFYQPSPGEPEMSIYFKQYSTSVTGTTFRNFMVFGARLDCSEGYGTGSGSITYTIPEDMANRDSWEIDSANMFDCSISEIESRSVKITCSGECTGYYDANDEFRLVTFPNDRI